MRYRLLPYRQGSRGAKALAVALGGRVLKLEGSAFTPRPSDVIINWGNTSPTSEAFPGWYRGGEVGKYLNYPQIIKYASNKLTFFITMQGSERADLIPEFWTNSEDIPDEAFPIVCRTVLAGHSGDGIVIADTRAGLVQCPLYVRYVKKADEYRVHVGKKGEEYVVIAVQRKARRTDVPNEQVNWQVRNHCNGFVFVRQGVEPNASITQAAIDALRCTGLDFGAVDVIWNQQKARPYVLEINTAPGLEGQTVTDYANFFRSLAG